MWAEQQWKVFLDDEQGIEAAIRYVEENPVKEGKPRQKWSFVTPFGGIHSPRRVGDLSLSLATIGRVLLFNPEARRRRCSGLLRHLPLLALARVGRALLAPICEASQCGACSLKGCDRLAQGNALGRERRRGFAGCNSNGKIC